MNNSTLGGITSLLPLILIIVIMYFLLIRPQKKREKEVNSMRDALRPGDKVVTIGGLYGTILRIKDNILVIQIGADKTKLEVARWAISNVLNDDMSERVAKAKSTAPETPEPEEPATKSRPKRLDKTAAATAPAPDTAAAAEAAPDATAAVEATPAADTTVATEAAEPATAKLDHSTQPNPLESND